MEGKVGERAATKQAMEVGGGRGGVGVVAGGEMRT